MLFVCYNFEGLASEGDFSIQETYAGRFCAREMLAWDSSLRKILSVGYRCRAHKTK